MRQIISKDEVRKMLDDFSNFLERKIEEKGDRSFASTHEILGAVSEEFDEFKESIRHNNKEETHHELYDIAVACLWGAASIRKGVEW